MAASTRASGSISAHRDRARAGSRLRGATRSWRAPNDARRASLALFLRGRRAVRRFPVAVMALAESAGRLLRQFRRRVGGVEPEGDPGMGHAFRPEPVQSAERPRLAVPSERAVAEPGGAGLRAAHAVRRAVPAELRDLSRGARRLAAGAVPRARRERAHQRPRRAALRAGPVSAVELLLLVPDLAFAPAGQRPPDRGLQLRPRPPSSHRRARHARQRALRAGARGARDQWFLFGAAVADDVRSFLRAAGG